MSEGAWLSLFVLLFLLGGLSSSYALMKLLNRRSTRHPLPASRDGVADEEASPPDR